MSASSRAANFGAPNQSAGGIPTRPGPRAATRPRRGRIRRERGAIRSSPRKIWSSPPPVLLAGRGPSRRTTSSPPVLLLLCSSPARPLLVPDSRAAGPARRRLTAAVLLVLDWNPSPPATPSPQGELPSLPCSSPFHANSSSPAHLPCMTESACVCSVKSFVY